MLEVPVGYHPYSDVEGARTVDKGGCGFLEGL